MGSPMIDLTELSGPELEQLQADIEAEQDRRRTLERVPEQIEELSQEYWNQAGIEDGQQWTPLVLGYPEGHTVTHPIPGTDEQGPWTSLLNRNTWEPGSDGGGWRLQPPGDGRPALWVRPSSTVDAYQDGDVVVFPDYETGDTYRSVWPNPNTWSPTEFPDAWELVQEQAPPSPRTPLTPEEPPDDDVPVWVRPIWGAEEGGAYAYGARVRYPGEDDPVYVSTHQGWNTWAPDEFGWEREDD